MHIEQIQTNLTQKFFTNQMIELPLNVRNDPVKMAWVIQVGKQSVIEKLITLISIAAKVYFKLLLFFKFLVA